MLNLQKIRDLCKDKRVTLKELAQNIKATEAAVQYMLKDNAISMKNLEKIANFFNVPVGYFFDEPIINQVSNGNNNHQVIQINSLQHEIDLLKKEIEGLKNELKAKNELIEVLKKIK